jgi:hypothetical protein
MHLTRGYSISIVIVDTHYIDTGWHCEKAMQNREAGVNPAQSRYCNWQGNFSSPLRRKSTSLLSCRAGRQEEEYGGQKSGDLPGG